MPCRCNPRVDRQAFLCRHSLVPLSGFGNPANRLTSFHTLLADAHPCKMLCKHLDRNVNDGQVGAWWALMSERLLKGEKAADLPVMQPTVSGPFQGPPSVRMVGLRFNEPRPNLPEAHAAPQIKLRDQKPLRSRWPYRPLPASKCIGVARRRRRGGSLFYCGAKCRLMADTVAKVPLHR